MSDLHHRIQTGRSAWINARQMGVSPARIAAIWAEYANHAREMQRRVEAALRDRPTDANIQQNLRTEYLMDVWLFLQSSVLVHQDDYKHVIGSNASAAKARFQSYAIRDQQAADRMREVIQRLGQDARYRSLFPELSGGTAGRGLEEGTQGTGRVVWVSDSEQNISRLGNLLTGTRVKGALKATGTKGASSASSGPSGASSSAAPKASAPSAGGIMLPSGEEKFPLTAPDGTQTVYRTRSEWQNYIDNSASLSDAQRAHYQTQLNARPNYDRHAGDSDSDSDEDM